MLAEGARFETPTAPETIGPDTSSLVRSQSITEESEAVEVPITPDHTGWFCHSLATGILRAERRQLVYLDLREADSTPSRIRGDHIQRCGEAEVR